MAEIEQYTVIDSHDLNELANEVTGMLIEDWEPQGGIAVAVQDGKALYYQALIKRSDSQS